MTTSTIVLAAAYGDMRWARICGSSILIEATASKPKTIMETNTTRQWDKLNFSSVIQQGDFRHRGEQGLFESVGFKLFDLAGTESPNTNYVHFRIVESDKRAWRRSIQQRLPRTVPGDRATRWSFP